MKKFLTMFAACGILFSGAPAFADDAKKETDSFKVESPYAFATSSMQKNGAVFFTFENMTDEDVKIVSAETDVSETVELHTHSMDGDAMQMREVENFAVPANSTVTLEPMGDHVMLMGLKKPLSMDAANETLQGSFPLTLNLDNGESVSISVDIVKPGDKPHAHTHDHGEHKHDHKHMHGGDHNHDHSHDHKHEDGHDHDHSHH